MIKTIRVRFIHGAFQPLEAIAFTEGQETVISFEEEVKEEKGDRKGKWARVAEKIRSQGNLTGKSEEIIQYVREFRDNFSF